MENQLIGRQYNKIYKIYPLENRKELLVDLNNLIDTTIELGGDYNHFEEYYYHNSNLILIKAKCNISCWDYEVYLYNFINCI